MTAATGHLMDWLQSKRERWMVAAVAILGVVVAVFFIARSVTASAGPSAGEILDDPDPTHAVASARALGWKPSERNRGTAARLIEDDPRPEVRGAAASALGAYEQTDPQTLAALLSDGDAAVRRGAAEGLAKWSTRERTAAVPHLAAMLDDPDPQVRSWAVTGLNRAVPTRRFPIDAAADPTTQRQAVADARRWLRSHGLM